jgi:hypothetical protein
VWRQARRLGALLDVREQVLVDVDDRQFCVGYYMCQEQ